MSEYIASSPSRSARAVESTASTKRTVTVRRSPSTAAPRRTAFSEAVTAGAGGSERSADRAGEASSRLPQDGQKRAEGFTSEAQ